MSFAEHVQNRATLLLPHHFPTARPSPWEIASKFNPINQHFITSHILKGWLLIPWQAVDIYRYVKQRPHEHMVGYTKVRRKNFFSVNQDKET